MNATLGIIENVLLVIIVLYLYYSAIVGIIKKRFSAIALLLITGAFGRASRGPLVARQGYTGTNLSGYGHKEMLGALENDEAINAAVVQLWWAVLITIAMLLSVLDSHGLLSDKMYNSVPIIVIISTLIAVFYIVRTANKYKKLKKTVNL